MGSFKSNFDSVSNNFSVVSDNKISSNKNLVLFSESSVLKNSTIADNYAVLTKYANSRDLLILFENLRVARANLKIDLDLDHDRICSINDKSNRKLNSLNSTSNFLLKDLASEEIMEVDTEPLPGKGKKFIFKAIVNNSEVNVIIDTGSSTTLVRKSLVIDLNLKHNTSMLPVNFLGMFGSKMVPDAAIAILPLVIGEKSLVMPAYILDSFVKLYDLHCEDHLI